ncbi:MAG TPA: lipocalin-like domain-containing protein [Bryobacteraceae bacterium]|jgi:predicted secreted hydrolase
MRSKAALALITTALVAQAQEWQLALAGYHYEFPRDYFNHENYQTEWWYYTGNVHSPDGHRYGFELTFFRQAVQLSEEVFVSEDDVWRPDQLYLAHLALTDIDAGTFYHTERLNRGGPGLAGISTNQRRYWNGNWQVRWSSLATGHQQLQAVCDAFTLALNLKPNKHAVVQGEDGLTRKGPLPGQASHYISFTRIAAEGQLNRNGKSIAVAGLAWMDHEFFTEPAHSEITRWDWFSIQLNNGEELMLYRIRNASDATTPYSSGTYVDARGRAQFLNAAEFSLVPGQIWQSPNSGARYPIGWSISVPSLGLQLSERTIVKDQEFLTKSGISPTYWEGAVTYEGQMRGRNAKAVGYLEMTGYAGSSRLGR